MQLSRIVNLPFSKQTVDNDICIILLYSNAIFMIIDYRKLF